MEVSLSLRQWNVFFVFVFLNHPNKFIYKQCSAISNTTKDIKCRNSEGCAHYVLAKQQSRRWDTFNIWRESQINLVIKSTACYTVRIMLNDMNLKWWQSQWLLVFQSADRRKAAGGTVLRGKITGICQLIYQRLSLTTSCMATATHQHVQ